MATQNLILKRWAAKLEHDREAKEWTQREFARRFGLTREQYSRFINGHRPPPRSRKTKAYADRDPRYERIGTELGWEQDIIDAFREDMRTLQEQFSASTPTWDDLRKSFIDTLVAQGSEHGSRSIRLWAHERAIDLLGKDSADELAKVSLHVGDAREAEEELKRALRDDDGSETTGQSQDAIAAERAAGDSANAQRSDGDSNHGGLLRPLPNSEAALEDAAFRGRLGNSDEPPSVSRDSCRAASELLHCACSSDQNADEPLWGLLTVAEESQVRQLAEMYADLAALNRPWGQVRKLLQMA